MKRTTTTNRGDDHRRTVTPTPGTLLNLNHTTSRKQQHQGRVGFGGLKHILIITFGYGLGLFAFSQWDPHHHHHHHDASSSSALSDLHDTLLLRSDEHQSSQQSKKEKAEQEVWQQQEQQQQQQPDRRQEQVGSSLPVNAAAIPGQQVKVLAVGSAGPRYQKLQQQRKLNFQSDLDMTLPKWIRDYIGWHREIRQKYPGAELFTNPDAPNVLLRTCLGLCGGLHDRLGQLPWDLYLANQTGRVLFLRWYRPKPIEDFLVPNAFNWSMPPHLPNFHRLQSVKHTITELFDGVDDSHPEADFWTTHLDAGIERARSGEYKNVKILRHRILGHLNEDELEKRLKALGETDMIHSTPSFGKLFFLFFHPHPAIEMELEDVYQALKIKPHQYSAVHCRVRHPKAFSKHIGIVKGKWDKYPADKTGLPWEGQTREFAVETATEAIQCAKTLQQDGSQEPIYFFSDSNDLVRYLTRELQNETFVKANHTLLKNNPIDWAAYQTIIHQNDHGDHQSSSTTTATRIVARDVDLENAHIDRQKGRAPPAYYGTFVDLFLAINARCITFGIGYYAVFAAKISGTHCKLLYTEEAWGGNERKKLLANVCTRKQEQSEKK